MTSKSGDSEADRLREANRQLQAAVTECRQLKERIDALLRHVQLPR
jgi:hypothetical protein